MGARGGLDGPARGASPSAASISSAPSFNSSAPSFPRRHPLSTGEARRLARAISSAAPFSRRLGGVRRARGVQLRGALRLPRLLRRFFRRAKRRRRSSSVASFRLGVRPRASRSRAARFASSACFSRSDATTSDNSRTCASNVTRQDARASTCAAWRRRCTRRTSTRDAAASAAAARAARRSSASDSESAFERSEWSARAAATEASRAEMEASRRDAVASRASARVVVVEDNAEACRSASASDCAAAASTASITVDGRLRRRLRRVRRLANRRDDRLAECRRERLCLGGRRVDQFGGVYSRPTGPLLGGEVQKTENRVRVRSGGSRRGRRRSRRSRRRRRR